MSQDQLMKYGIAAAIIFGGYKYGSGVVKASAIAVGAVIVAKQIPYLNQVV